MGLFADWLGNDRDITEVKRADAGRYVTEVLEPSGLLPKTIRDHLSDLHAFLEWAYSV